MGVRDRAREHDADQVGISVCTDRAGAAVASVLLNSSPFFVALIARLALRELITRLRAVGLVIGFAGVLLVVLADPGKIAHGSRLAIGLALALLGALGWAGGGLGMRVLASASLTLTSPATLPPSSSRAPSISSRSSSSTAALQRGAPRH